MVSGKRLPCKTGPDDGRVLDVMTAGCHSILKLVSGADLAPAMAVRCGERPKWIQPFALTLSRHQPGHDQLRPGLMQSRPGPNASVMPGP